MGNPIVNLGNVFGSNTKKKSPDLSKYNPDLGKVRYADEHAELFERKFKEKGGENHFGSLIKKGWKAWYYQWGCICYNSTTNSAHEIYGDIYKKWQQLGGIRWGIPTTDESPCADGIGRYNHFCTESGMVLSIFWSPSSGANGIYGEIRRRWVELGYERSYLGYPTTDEVDFPDNGRANGFQNGDIYYWADTGPIDMNNVKMFFSGLYCKQESAQDQSSNSDEPYVIIGVSSANSTASYTTPIFSDVDSHESMPGWLEIYNGKPYGINLSAVVMENDFGDPNKFRDQIQSVLMANHEIGTAALGFIPVAGPLIAAIIGPALGKLMPKIGDAINDALGTEDDLVGSSNRVISAKEMVLLSKTPPGFDNYIINHFYMTIETKINEATPAGSYRVYFQLIRD